MVDLLWQAYEDNRPNVWAFKFCLFMRSFHFIGNYLISALIQCRNTIFGFDSFVFFALHMRAVPLNVSSMCWRWRRQACRCSFICHFVLIYCADYEWPPRAAVSMSGMLWCGDRAERDRRIRRAGPSRWNVLSVSVESLRLRGVRRPRGPWMGFKGSFGMFKGYVKKKRNLSAI